MAVVWAQAGEVAGAANKVVDRTLDYGIVGVVILLLFVALAGLIYLGMQLWGKNQEWFQGEIKRQSEASDKRFAEQNDAFEGRLAVQIAASDIRIKEQAVAFLSALDRGEHKNSEQASQFIAALKDMKADQRAETKAVIGIAHDKLNGLDAKLDRYDSKLDKVLQLLGGRDEKR